MRDRMWKSVVLAAAYSLIVLCGNASGAGFATMEQSVRGLGTAFAGGAAAADDASTIFYNPAGLTRLSDTQIIAGLHTILPSATFRNEGSLHVTGQPLSGNEGGEAGATIFAPNVYISHRVSDRLGVGMGMYVPFGVNTEYDPSWVGRYHAVKSDLKTVNINPAVAWRLSEKLSLGAGVNLQYIGAELSNAVDFGMIFATLGVPGMVPQGNDGFVTFEGDSWSVGYNLGVLYEITKDTRAGIA